MNGSGRVLPAGWPRSLVSLRQPEPMLGHQSHPATGLHLVRVIAVMRMAVRVAVTVRVAVPRVVAVIEVMMHLRRGNSCLLQLLLKTPLDPWVFLIGLDLLDIQRYA